MASAVRQTQYLPTKYRAPSTEFRLIRLSKDTRLGPGLTLFASRGAFVYRCPSKFLVYVIWLSAFGQASFGRYQHDELAQVFDPDTLQTVIRGLGSEDDAVRAAAKLKFHSLQLLSDPDVGMFVPSDHEYRRNVQRFASELEKLLDSQDNDSRQIAITLIGQMGSGGSSLRPKIERILHHIEVPAIDLKQELEPEELAKFEQASSEAWSTFFALCLLSRKDESIFGDMDPKVLRAFGIDLIADNGSIPDTTSVSMVSEILAQYLKLFGHAKTEVPFLIRCCETEDLLAVNYAGLLMLMEFGIEAKDALPRLQKMKFANGKLELVRAFCIASISDDRATAEPIIANLGWDEFEKQKALKGLDCFLKDRKKAGSVTRPSDPGK